MSEWKKVKLGKLYGVHNGLSKGRQFFGSGYPFLTFSNVFNNWFLPEELDSLVQSTEKERDACSIKRGDVFITRTSETMNELGMSSVALKDYPNATYNGFTKRLRPISDEIVPEYIGYYLRSPKFRGKFMAFSSMTTRASLANDDLLSMEVELPNKTIQIAIAEFLSRYDSLIDNYQKQIKLLEEAAQRLYKECFVDLHFPGHENTKIVDGVPERWEKTNINNILTFHRGYDLTHKEFVYGPYPVVGSTSIIGSHNKYKIEGPGIVTGRSGSLGVYQLIWENYWPHNTSLYISDFKGHDVFYIYCLLKTVDFTTLNSGGAIPSLNRNTLSSIPVVEPPKDLQQDFSRKAMPLFKKQKALESQIRLLTEARDRLLPKLMSGEISVDFLCNIQEHAQSIGSGLEVRNGRTDSPQATDS
jgi:type I restriction enzyme S subunit